MDENRISPSPLSPRSRRLVMFERRQRFAANSISGTTSGSHSASMIQSALSARFVVSWASGSPVGSQLTSRYKPPVIFRAKITGRERAMATDEVTLFLAGAPEHRGHVLAHALRDKLDKFLRTFGGFERAYIGKRVRQTDFEITTLSPASAHLGLHPVSRVQNYAPAPAVDWTLSQWEKIVRGERPDTIVDDELVADVVELASQPEGAAFHAFIISYGAYRINFDDKAEANALALRAALVSARAKLPWMKGLSRGSFNRRTAQRARCKQRTPDSHLSTAWRDAGKVRISRSNERSDKRIPFYFCSRDGNYSLWSLFPISNSDRN